MSSRLRSPSGVLRPTRFFFKAQLQCQYPYFELDREQKAMCILLLIKQETEYIE